MTRLWASLLTVIIYLLSQFLPAVIVNTTQFAQYSDLEQLKAGI
ncbi:TPA: CPBP family intramembrane metalloprotease, partial [Staphylococcus aureus]|nr:CPBP family intramembrane metalloprotease [Staphylococcus aureus]